ncbi:MAG: 16S rRNA pseudouridine(516) synthase RsuA [Gammaproteobacteria bacterium]|nr:16S rRNA pseudouridine(516) synthase RsuA [Gammaproteobacteria bacterium]
MRLDKFVSHATGLPREISKRLIRKRQVQVNGAMVSNAAFQVEDTDSVTLEGETLHIPGPRYLMLHKPSGVVCATEDGDHPTVLDLIEDMDTEGLSIGGRLDIDTTGLVLLSDDGQWLHRVTSPRHLFSKVYRATLQEPLDQQTIDSFAAGMLLRGEGKRTAPAQCEALPDNGARVTLNEGRYHQIKRMFAACGNHVLSLHREKIGAVALDDTLTEGEYRVLTETEIKSFTL